jgi:SAM-dependent methyltransferase
MKLHLGCGRHHLHGYVNIDVIARPEWKAPDMLHALHPDHPLPFEAGSIDEILAVHLFEHFYLWEAQALLKQWAMLLRRGGSLVLELPNLTKCAVNLLAGEDWSMCMFGLYGDPQTKDPYMTHKWGWTPQTLEAEMHNAGFFNVREEIPRWHPKGRYNRDMRLVGERA